MSQGITIRRIKRKEFGRLFEITSETSSANAITGLNEQRFWRIAKLYRLAEMILPLFDILRIDVFDTILVAVWGGRIVGEIHLVPLGKGDWVINSAAVDPRFGRRGIFKSLMGQGLEYISTRQGERVFGSFRTDIVAVDKVMCRLFGFEVFEKLLLLQLRLHEIPKVKLDENVTIREAKRTDLEGLCQLSHSISTNKPQAKKMAPSDFLEPLLGRVASILTWSDSERWVMEVQGEIAGYARFTYTPPQKSGEIDSFYLLPSAESSGLARSLLGTILEFLYKKNVRKVVIYLDEEWNTAIETFKSYGFKPLASYFNTVKELRSTKSAAKKRLDKPSS